MRKVFSVGLMAAMIAMVGMTRDASATVTISLRWETCTSCVGFVAGASNTITANAGTQTARLGIFLSHDDLDEVQIYNFSLAYDQDLANELNVNTLVMNTSEWAGTDVDPSGMTDLFAPLGGLAFTESGVVAGAVQNIDSASLGGNLPGQGLPYSAGTFVGVAPLTPYRVGFVTFIINGAVTDGVDIISGDLFGPDGIFDGLGNDIVGQTTYDSATVNLVPEPGTASLLGLGLVGLVLAGRRTRR